MGGQLKANTHVLLQHNCQLKTHQQNLYRELQDFANASDKNVKVSSKDLKTLKKNRKLVRRISIVKSKTF